MEKSVSFQVASGFSRRPEVGKKDLSWEISLIIGNSRNFGENSEKRLRCCQITTFPGGVLAPPLSTGIHTLCVRDGEVSHNAFHPRQQSVWKSVRLTFPPLVPVSHAHSLILTNHRTVDEEDRFSFHSSLRPHRFSKMPTNVPGFRQLKFVVC